MDRVHGGGPWTRGPCFVLSPYVKLAIHGHGVANNSRWRGFSPPYHTTLWITHSLIDFFKNIHYNKSLKSLQRMQNTVKNSIPDSRRSAILKTTSASFSRVCFGTPGGNCHHGFKGRSSPQSYARKLVWKSPKIQGNTVIRILQWEAFDGKSSYDGLLGFVWKQALV